MSAPGSRMRRVDEAMREVLADVLTGPLADPRLGFVTVTEVHTTPDLRHARVYVSVYGTEQERSDSLAGLTSAAGLMQARIARELRLKRTPTLSFELDDSADRAERIDQLLAAEEQDQ